MINSNPDLINSCLVCRNPNQDGDYECLYEATEEHEDKPILSGSGILYENLLNISIVTWHNYPQFLCHSCDLQMKLFKKLKDKAYKTLEYLEHLYQIDNINEESEQIALEVFEEYEQVSDTEEIVEIDKEYASVTNLTDQSNRIPEYQLNTMDDYQINNHAEQYEEASCEDYLDHRITLDTSNTEQDQLEQENFNNEENLEIAPLSHESMTNSLNLEIESKIKELKYNSSIVETSENSFNSQDTMPQLKLDLEPIIDRNDYVTEIYELLEDGFNTDAEDKDHIMKYDVFEDDKTSPIFSDEEYIVEEISDDSHKQKNNSEVENVITHKRRRLNRGIKRRCVNGGVTATTVTKKRVYTCEACKKVFKNSMEQKMHRKEVHNGNYPCSVCFKELSNLGALYSHMKLHSEKPAYQCDICQKTFNQKTHYQYHMKKHNNERNFKCNECEKAFITNTDLKTHQRLHTGQRPYVCNICGKDYLMMEHLKSHMLIHTGQHFECEICKGKFVTHKTLRQHMKTIHVEPMFKCTFCEKSFRRKHHLENHLRLHQSNVKLLDTHYEMVDDDGNVNDPDNPDEVVEKGGEDFDESLLDDPGFIAINDDII